MCEVGLVVDSTTGTTDKASSVLVGPAPCDACCPKRLTAWTDVEVAVVAKEDRPTDVAVALLVTEATELVLVYRIPSCLGSKPDGWKCGPCGFLRGPASTADSRRIWDRKYWKCMAWFERVK